MVYFSLMLISLMVLDFFYIYIYMFFEHINYKMLSILIFVYHLLILGFVFLLFGNNFSLNKNIRFT